MVPVTCGTSYRNKGVQKLLDAIVDYMPSPIDIPHIKGINPETGEEDGASVVRRRAVLRSGVQDCDRPVCGQAVLLPRVLRYAERGYHGITTLQRATRSVLAVSCMMHANHRKDIETVLCRRYRRCGRLKEYHHRRHALRSEDTRSFWSPWSSRSRLSALAIEPKTKAGQEKMGIAPCKARGRGSDLQNLYR